MQEYIEFLYRHWELSLAFMGVVMALIITELRRVPGNGISSQQAVNLINHQHAMVIDLRSYEAYKTGHIVGAINMPLSDLDSKLQKFTKSTKKPVILVCTSGQSAQKSLVKFTAQGFTSVLYLSGGLQAWSTEGLPITGE